MPGIDPSILASIGSNQAYPGSPPSPVNVAPGGADDGGAQAEPVALHEACTAACEAIKDARAKLEDLSAQAEMAEDIDPKAEKALTQAAQMIAKIDDSMAMVEQTLGAARQDHEGMVNGGDDDDAGAMPPA